MENIEYKRIKIANKIGQTNDMYLYASSLNKISGGRSTEIYVGSCTWRSAAEWSKESLYSTESHGQSCVPVVIIYWWF